MIMRPYYFLYILLSICIVSCSKVSNIEEEEYISQSLIGEPGAVFAQIVQQNINI